MYSFRHIQRNADWWMIMCFNPKDSQVSRCKNKASNWHSLNHICFLITQLLCTRNSIKTLWISFSPSVGRFIIPLLARSASDNHRKCKIATRSNIVIDLITRACIMAAISRTSLAKKTRWTTVSLRYVTVRATEALGRKRAGKCRWMARWRGSVLCLAENWDVWCSKRLVLGIYIDDRFREGATTGIDICRLLENPGKAIDETFGYLSFSRFLSITRVPNDMYRLQEWINVLSKKTIKQCRGICWRFHNNKINYETNFHSLKVLFATTDPN